MEQLTDAVEARAMELIGRVDELGGAASAIRQGFFQEEIARSAYEHQLRVEAGDTVVVGVNRFSDGLEPPIIPAPDFSALEADQRARLAATKADRNADDVQHILGALRDAALSYAESGVDQHGGERAGSSHQPLMPLIIDAVRARASVGEISDTLEGMWSRHVPE